MRAEDLMIGDWVRDTDPTPYRVAIIDAPSFVTGDDMFVVDMGDVQPIPLTAEILQKNGFDNLISEWEMLSDGYKITAEPFGDDEWLVIADKVNTGKVRLLVMYVHQLQHILRLLGIDKQIELRLLGIDKQIELRLLGIDKQIEL